MLIFTVCERFGKPDDTPFQLVLEPDGSQVDLEDLHSIIEHYRSFIVLFNSEIWQPVTLVTVYN